MQKTILTFFFALFIQQLYAQYVYLNKGFLPCAADTASFYYAISERTQINDTAFAVKIAAKNSLDLYVRMMYKDSSTTIKHGAATFFESGTKNKRSAGYYYNNQKQGEWRFYDENKLTTSYMYKAGLLEGAAYQYFADGTKNKLVEYENDNKVGTYLSLHEDGKTVRFKGQYKDGKEDGNWLSYYENGTQAAAEQFSMGELAKYELYDEKGKKMKNKDYKALQKPMFPGGEASLMKYLANRIVYPEYARYADIQGKVFIGFIVEKDGSISNVKMIRSPHKLLSDEAIKVVENMPTWSVGMEHNVPVRVQYTLPVQFKLD